MSGRAAVFLDRDGVLTPDQGFLIDPVEVRLMPGAAMAVARLKAAGYALVVVTNQPVIGRGLATEGNIQAVHDRMRELLRAEGGDDVDAVYACPHHPHADVERYRAECDCRKPRPGLLLQATEDLDLDPARSFMIGDRVTDVIAGQRAGCRTALLETGRHGDPVIVTPDAVDPDTQADRTLPDLSAAADWILAG